ncbi:hypothetical protein GCM10028777_40600 [Angustibacter speluncae]
MVALAALLGAAAVVVGWALSSPVGSAPDEDSHTVYAWGVATGQVGPGRDRVELRQLGGEPEVIAPFLVLDVPPDLGAQVQGGCYRFNWALPAACPDAAPTPVAETYMTRYPPLPYAVLGTALRAQLALGVGAEAALLGTRVVAGLLAVALLAPAVALLARRYGSAAAAVGTGVALTPMAVYLGPTVNPSGLEVAATVAGAAVVCVLRHDALAGGPVGRGPQALLVVTVTVLAWTRPISWLWAGLLLALLLVPPAWGRGWWRRLPAWRLSPWTIGLVVAAVAGAVAWTVYAAGLRVGDVPYEEAWLALPPWGRLLLVLLKTGDLVQQAVGVLGWLDTPLPSLYLLAWVAAATWLAVRAARPRPDRAAAVDLPARWVAAFAVTALVVVVVHSVLTAYGYQGRYVLPVLAAAAVLLVPSLAPLRPDAFLRPRGIALLLALAALQGFALLWHLWRYAYGARMDNPRLPPAPLPTAEPAWSPPPGQEIVVLLTGAGLLALVVAVVLAGRLDVLAARASRPARRPAHEEVAA